MTDAVDEAVRAAGGGDVLRKVPAPAGERNDVWLVDSASAGPLVVRFLADGRRREMEVALLQRVAASGVPVAEVLWSAADPVPVMVQRHLRGELLADVEPTDALCRSVAEVLRSIHETPIGGGHGNLDPDLRGEDDRLSTWFTARVEVEAGATRAHLSPPDAALVDDHLARLRGAARLLDAQPSGLAHGDVQPFNVLVEGDRVTGVVDWEAAKAGPPAFDFGWWDWFSAARSTPWPTDLLLVHYDPEHRLDRDELAHLRRLVVTRVWLRELLTAASRRDEARADAARRGLAGLPT
jgi:aminoglycoside phosphotransferase (APT) family kinase protein